MRREDIIKGLVNLSNKNKKRKERLFVEGYYEKKVMKEMEERLEEREELLDYLDMNIVNNNIDMLEEVLDE